MSKGEWMKNAPIRLATVLSILFVLGMATPSGSSTIAPRETGTFRLLRTIHFKYPVVDCHGLQGSFDCVENSTVPETFDISAASSAVDVLMTLTVTYRTTGGDAAFLTATLRPKAAGKYMDPGGLPLRPSTTTTTSTLRWTASDVPPDVYRIGFQTTYGRNAKLPLKIWEPKATMIIEAWTGGAP